MSVRETTAPGRGSMTASLRVGIHTAIDTIAGEAAVTVVAAAAVGARITSGTGTGTETESGTGTGIAAGAGRTAEPGLEAGVEVRT